jgi:hypothetical protein
MTVMFIFFRYKKHVIWQGDTNDSERPAAYIFRVDKEAIPATDIYVFAFMPFEGPQIFLVTLLSVARS